MRRLDNVPCDDGGGDCRKLIAEIQDSANSADAFSWSDERGDGPSHRRSRGQSSDREADPEECRSGALGMRSAEDAESEAGPADENHLTNAHGVPAALDQCIDEPSTDDEIRESCEQPGHAGVSNGVQQIHIVDGKEIGRQPGQEQVESIIITGKSERQSTNPPLPKQIPEWRSFRRLRTIFGLRSALGDEMPLGI